MRREMLIRRLHRYINSLAMKNNELLVKYVIKLETSSRKLMEY